MSRLNIRLIFFCLVALMLCIHIPLWLVITQTHDDADGTHYEGHHDPQAAARRPATSKVTQNPKPRAVRRPKGDLSDDSRGASESEGGSDDDGGGGGYDKPWEVPALVEEIAASVADVKPRFVKRHAHSYSTAAANTPFVPADETEPPLPPRTPAPPTPEPAPTPAPTTPQPAALSDDDEEMKHAEAADDASDAPRLDNEPEELVSIDDIRPFSEAGVKLVEGASTVLGARGSQQDPQLSVVLFVGDGRSCPSSVLLQIDAAVQATVRTEVLVLGGDHERIKASVFTKLHRVKALRLFSFTDTDDVPLTFVPNPWHLVHDIAAVVHSQSLVFLGPGVSGVSGTLLKDLHARLWATTLLGVASPAVVGCTVTSAVLQHANGARSGGQFIISHGSDVAPAQGDVISVTDALGGFPVGDARAAVERDAVLPSPYCYATSVEDVKRYWPMKPDSTHAPTPIPLFRAYADAPLASREDATFFDRHYVEDLHGVFAAFVLEASYAALAAAHNEAGTPVTTRTRNLKTETATPAADTKGVLPLLRPVPVVPARIVVAARSWTPQGPRRADTGMNPLTLATPSGHRIATDAALQDWLRQLASPRPALRPGVPPPAIVWGTFCIKCFGFSNEVMHFAWPLEARVPIRLCNNPDCFCPGTPRTFSASLARMNMRKNFEADFRRRNAKAPIPASEAAIVWVSHKDPGSFPTTQFEGLMRRPDVVVGRGMYEFNVVPSNWARKDRLVDELWVPSRYVRWVFEQAGFAKDKLFVMPEPLDVHLYSPDAVQRMRLPIRHKGWSSGSNRPAAISVDQVDEATGHSYVPAALHELRGHYKFFAVFKWESRKAWDVLLRAYYRAFKSTDKVSLYLVSYVYGDSGRDPNKMLNMAEDVAKQLKHDAARAARRSNKDGDGGADDVLDEINRLKQGADDDVLRAEEEYHGSNDRAWSVDAPHVEIISEQLSEADLIGLYRSCDAFVLPTRGEGWGLPIIQAMAMGMPTIATNWSGNVDFMTDANSYPLKIDGLEEVPSSSEYGAAPGKMWAKPSEDHLVELMRRVFTDREEAAAVGRRAREHVVQHYSDEAIAQLVVERAAQLAADVAERKAQAAETQRPSPPRPSKKRSGADALANLADDDAGGII